MYGYTQSLRDVFKMFFPFSFLLSLSLIPHRIFHCTLSIFVYFMLLQNVWDGYSEITDLFLIKPEFENIKVNSKCPTSLHLAGDSATSSHRASLKSNSICKMESPQNILFLETYWHENTGFPVIIMSVHFLEPSWHNHLWDVYFCILLYLSYPCIKGQNYCVLAPQKHWYSLNLILPSFSEIFSHSWN